MSTCTIKITRDGIEPSNLDVRNGDTIEFVRLSSDAPESVIVTRDASNDTTLFGGESSSYLMPGTHMVQAVRSEASGTYRLRAFDLYMDVEVKQDTRGPILTDPPVISNHG